FLTDAIAAPAALYSLVRCSSVHAPRSDTVSAYSASHSASGLMSPYFLTVRPPQQTQPCLISAQADLRRSRSCAPPRIRDSIRRCHAWRDDTRGSRESAPPCADRRPEPRAA